MTRFLDMRTWPVGGPLSHRIAVCQGTSIDDYKGLDENQLRKDVSGQHVLIATHGFNVNRKDGIACLSVWEGLVIEQLPAGWLYIGVLGLADRAGARLGPYLDGLLAAASSVSFTSHSLGARLVLQTVRNMKRSPSNAVLMAGAINDDCLSGEFNAEANRIGSIAVLASNSDDVLKLAFPLGNLAAGILDQGHPWLSAALGRTGPAPIDSAPAAFHGPWQIPDDWGYGHHHYLQTDPVATDVKKAEADVPPQDTDEPVNGAPGWQQTFSSIFAATRLQE